MTTFKRTINKVKIISYKILVFIRVEDLIFQNFVINYLPPPPPHIGNVLTPLRNITNNSYINSTQKNNSFLNINGW